MVYQFGFYYNIPQMQSFIVTFLWMQENNQMYLFNKVLMLMFSKPLILLLMVSKTLMHLDSRLLKRN